MPARGEAAQLQHFCVAGARGAVKHIEGLLLQGERIGFIDPA